MAQPRPDHRTQYRATLARKPELARRRRAYAEKVAAHLRGKGIATIDIGGQVIGWEVASSNIYFEHKETAPGRSGHYEREETQTLTIYLDTNGGLWIGTSTKTWELLAGRPSETVRTHPLRECADDDMACLDMQPKEFRYRQGDYEVRGWQPSYPERPIFNEWSMGLSLALNRLYKKHGGT